MDKEVGILEDMFCRQRYVLDQFILKRGFPQYPLHLEPRENQVFIKKVVYWLVEELYEVHQAYEDCLQFVSTNKPQESVFGLRNLNEEIGDSFHLLLELLIYVGWDYPGLFYYYCHYKFSQGYFDPVPDNMIYSDLWSMGAQIVQRAPLEYSPRSVFTIADPNGQSDCPFGKEVSIQMLRGFEYLMFSCMSSFVRAGSLLKNKEWRKSITPVNQTDFYEHIYNGLVSYFAVLHFLGGRENDLWLVFRNKNEIVKNRLENGY